MISHPVANEYDFIRGRIAEITEADRPRCPINTSRILHDCLRGTKCPDECPYIGDWVGSTGPTP